MGYYIWAKDEDLFYWNGKVQADIQTGESELDAFKNHLKVVAEEVGDEITSVTWNVIERSKVDEILNMF